MKGCVLILTPVFIKKACSHRPTLSVWPPAKAVNGFNDVDSGDIAFSFKSILKTSAFNYRLVKQ